MSTSEHSSAIPTLELNDGASIPQLGLGTYAMHDAEGVGAIIAGIDSGYRLLDTAVNYKNEREVGQAVIDSKVGRDELFITSKVPGRHHGFDETIASTEESLARLQLERLDLHLIHWPNPSVGKYVDTWRGLIELRERGLVTSIGVSNFTEAMLQELIDENVTFKTFFERAKLNPKAELITGVICGYRIEEIENTLTRQVRYLDKLIDELAKGKKMEKILRE